MILELLTAVVFLTSSFIAMQFAHFTFNICKVKVLLYQYLNDAATEKLYGLSIVKQSAAMGRIAYAASE